MTTDGYAKADTRSTLCVLALGKRDSRTREGDVRAPVYSCGFQNVETPGTRLLASRALTKTATIFLADFLVVPRRSSPSLPPGERRVATIREADPFLW